MRGHAQPAPREKSGLPEGRRSDPRGVHALGGRGLVEMVHERGADAPIGQPKLEEPRYPVGCALRSASSSTRRTASASNGSS